MSEHEASLKIESGVILPTWPSRTAILKVEGKSQLLVLVDFVELESVSYGKVEEPSDDPA